MSSTITTFRWLSGFKIATITDGLSHFYPEIDQSRILYVCITYDKPFVRFKAGHTGREGNIHKREIGDE